MKHLRFLPVFLIVALTLIALPAQGQSETPTLPTTPTANAALSRLSATPTLACVGAPRTRLIVRERARITFEDPSPSPLNVRSGAGTSFNILDHLDAGDIVFVISGPVCSQHYAWYQIEHNGIEGWVAEGSGEYYYIEVYPPE